MRTDNTTSTFTRANLQPCENYEATYCPEDDKLRLYVGRVPRDEYNFLRAEGWTSTPKQSEAGQGEFSAVWTPGREATALQYAGFIGDEDTPPTERAADRAERFGGYMAKRAEEAGQHADRYDIQPSAHGFQNEHKAERAAARHDRIGDRATDQWSKAEYWQRRTAGVIEHALHKSSPGVRMGRIKTLEAELRRVEKSWQESTARAQARYDALISVVEHAAGIREKLIPADRQDFVWELSKIREAAGTPEKEKSPSEHYRRAVVASALSSYRDSDANKEKADEAKAGTRPAADIAAEWLDSKTRPENFSDSAWTIHLKLRLAYENQMLEAQGGRAAMVEMEVGGWLGKHQIRKINRSNATGRVVSVGIMWPTKGCNKWGRPDPTAPEFRLEIINIERLESSVYTPPTAEDKAKLAADKKAEKAAAPKTESCPLINPTDEDAERLQAIWNEEAQASREAAKKRNGWAEEFKPATVCRMTQAQYSGESGGTYSRVSTRGIRRAAVRQSKSQMSNREETERANMYGAPVCKLRLGDSSGWHGAPRVIVITDKPQKPLPACMWDARATPAKELQTA